MAVLFNKYNNSTDYTWYDSSNVLFSECKDIDSETKDLKIVFKGGRTYVYKDVQMKDYIIFKTSESNGKSLNENIIKKYKCDRIDDTDLSHLEEMKERFVKENELMLKICENIKLDINYDEDSKRFSLYLNGNLVFEGKDNDFSIIKLLNSIGITYNLKFKKK